MNFEIGWTAKTVWCGSLNVWLQQKDKILKYIGLGCGFNRTPTGCSISWTV